MKFSKRIAVAVVSLGFSGMSNVAFAQDRDFSQVETKTIPITENIYSHSK